MFAGAVVLVQQSVDLRCPGSCICSLRQSCWHQTAAYRYKYEEEEELERKTDKVARKTAIFGEAPTGATRAIQYCIPQPRRGKRSDKTERAGIYKTARTDGLHEKSIIIKVVL
jgi:hypothetical protein